MRFTLSRTQCTDTCTLGTLTDEGGDFSCFTLEPPGEGLYPDIPLGTYRVVINHSNRFNRMLPQILDVPGRSGIRIHPGNVSGDTEGCILLGLTQTWDSVGESRLACEAFQSLIAPVLANGDDVFITVIDSNRGQ